jgi:hypothetical protein
MVKNVSSICIYITFILLIILDVSFEHTIVPLLSMITIIKLIESEKYIKFYSKKIKKLYKFILLKIFHLKFTKFYISHLLS